ncbi:MAG: hypothetical protein ACYTEU_06180 [Planctomycetota bacterium]|jgi:hypothetical protein
MKKWLIVLSVALGIGAAALVSRPAECAFCLAEICYFEGNCGSGCFCLKKGLDTTGVCYSISGYKEQM